MLDKDFLSGNYQKAILRSFDPKVKSRPSDVPGLIGSLCFSGKLAEAKILYKESYNVLNDCEKSACRFFLGLAYTRKSHYKKASKIFRTNLRSLNSNSTSLQKFYVYQGVAFYLFFLGKFQLSRKWALKSFDAAIEARDLYGRSLSTDLLAHIKLRLGEINVGLDLLKSATKLSKQIGNKSLTEAIEIAQLQYEAQYGHNRAEILNQLETKFSQLVSEDNYSRAAIGLELSRQYTLRGKFDLSEKILEAISTNIFATENRRQEIQLNLRYAENFYQMGKIALSWNYLRSARRCLDFEADKTSEIQILGFEYKLFEGPSKDAIKNDISNRSLVFNNIINANILSRNGIADEDSKNREDLFNDFLLTLKDETDRFSKILESGYLTFLFEELKIKRGESVLYLDTQSSRVILFFSDKIEAPITKLTPTDSKLLQAILAGVSEKADICSRVWGHDYDPLRHDNVIYTAIRSLRKNLGSASSWIETSENGYHFSVERKYKVNLKKQYQSDTSISLKLSENQEGPEDSSNDLNLRQVKSLKYLTKNEYLDVATYQQLFNVSDVTASRDLRTLKKMGLVVSMGKARAIKYLLNQNRI